MQYIVIKHACNVTALIYAYTILGSFSCRHETLSAIILTLVHPSPKMGIETYPICDRSVRRSVAPLQRDEIPVLTCGRGIVYLRNHDLITRTKKRKLLLSGRDTVSSCVKRSPMLLYPIWF